MSPHPGQELLSAHADGAAPEAELKSLEAHLADCGSCRGALAELKSVSKLLKNLPKAELPVGFMSRLERRRREEQSPSYRPMGLTPYRLAAFAATGILISMIFFREVRYRLAPEMLGSASGIESGGMSLERLGAQSQDSAGDAGVAQARRNLAVRGAWSSAQQSNSGGAASAAAGFAAPPLAVGRLKGGAPLDAGPSVSNDEIHNYLEKEKVRMGIQQIVPPGAKLPAAEGIPDQPLSKEEAMGVMRRMTSQLTRINRESADKRSPSVTIGGGSTPRIIGSRDGSLSLAEAAGKKSLMALGGAGGAGSLAMLRGAPIRVDEPASFEPPPSARPPLRMEAKADAKPASVASAKTLAPRGSWSATLGGLGKAGGAVITNAADWADLWKRVGRAEPLPQVDFSTEMALAVFAERDEARQGSIELLSATEEGGALVVRYRARVEAGAGPSSPYHAIVTPKSEFPVSFIPVP